MKCANSFWGRHRLRTQGLNLNVTDLRKVITPINPCAGGLGEALRPPIGGFGESPPIMVFLQTTIFRLSQCHST